MIYRLKRKNFTKYDETDALKRMKDSDILAEKPKTSSSKPVIGTALSAGLGGAALGGLSGAFGKKANGSLLSRMGKGGKKGALIGAGIGLAVGLSRKSKKDDANDFFNRRLEYAQRQAKRREKKDWKDNMTNREGYSY